jgi:hypothetical protein
VRCWKAVERPQLIELADPVRRSASQDGELGRRAG